METLDRPAARTRPNVRLDLVGFGLVVAGYVAGVGCVTMFAGEGREDRFAEAEFRRQLDAL